MADDAGHDPAVWRSLAGDLGVPGLHLPEALGGQGFTAVEQGIALQEMGRALLCAPYFGSIVLAATAVAEGATASRRDAIVPALVSGERIGALALSEATGRWDAGGIALEAAPGPGGHRLTGEKHYVIDGHVADDVFVVARAPGSRGDAGLSLFHVAGDAPGLNRRLQPTMDATRKLAHLTFDGVAAERVSDDGAFGPALARTLDLAAVALANEMVGAAEKVLETTVEYAKTRVQFGRPIGSFQAIKHKCADTLVDVELAKSAAIHAAAVAAGGGDDLGEVASLAKAFVADAFVRTASESIQIHGGIGFTWEHDCHLYFKRARSSALLLGDSDWHRERLASRLDLIAEGAA